MEITFQKAIIVSFAFHAAFLAPFYRICPTSEIPRKDVLIDYIVIKEPAKPKDGAKDVELKIPETPEVELKPRIETATAPDVPIAKVETDKDAPREMADKQARSNNAPAAPSALAHVKTTKDYIGYYQLLREKIRDRVKRRYRTHYGDGEVEISFSISSNGTLLSSEVIAASQSGDRVLRDVTLASLRDAAPFPPFPKAISLSEMAFNVTVVFKKER